MKKGIGLFIWEKPVELLIAIYQKPSYLYSYSRITGSNNLYRILELFEEFNLIKTERKVKTRMIILTKEGKELAEDFIKVRNKLEKLKRFDNG